MIAKTNDWAGYARLICLLIVCLISLSLSHAQAESADFLWASSDATGFIAHIRLADGLSVENAELVTSAETISLNSRPLAAEQWLILDASAAVVNTAPAIQAALADFIAAPSQNIGLIRFAAQLETLAPTNKPTDLAAWLGEYRALSNETACLGDALNWLNEQARQRDHARQVLAIVGAYQACDYPTFDFPLDILAVGADPAPYGATAQAASLQTLRPRLTAIRGQWAEPLIALEGTSPTIAQGNLNLSLSNGENLSFAIHYDLVFVPTPEPTASPEPSATLAPSATPSPEPSATEATAELTAPSQATVSAEAVETPVTPPLPVSNNFLIIAGGIAAVLVVLVVMALLLRGNRRTPSKLDDTIDNTMVFRYNDEAELDQTDIVSMRQMLAQIRPTLAGRLSDEIGNIYEIHRPITTLGRREDSDIRIMNDKQISREHLRFSVRDDGSIWLTRLSQNPVLLNEIAVETSLQLKNGDSLRLSPNLLLKLEIVNE